MNTLTSIREEVKDALKEEGYNAAEYVAENIVPPVCIVVPSDSYITTPVGQNPFGHYSVTLQVLLIGGKGTNKTAAEKIDSMIIGVVDTLDEQWDVTEVTAPQNMNLKGINYIGAVVTLVVNTKLTKEVI